MLSIVDLEAVSREELSSFYPDELLPIDSLRYMYIVSQLKSDMVYDFEHDLITNDTFAQFYLLSDEELFTSVRELSTLGIDLSTSKRYLAACILAAIEDSSMWKYVCMFDKARADLYKRYIFIHYEGSIRDVERILSAGLVIPTRDELVKMSYFDLLSLPEDYDNIVSRPNFLLRWQREHMIFGTFSSLADLEQTVGEKENLRCISEEKCAVLAARTDDLELFVDSLRSVTDYNTIIANIRTVPILRVFLRSEPQVITTYPYHLMLSIVKRDDFVLLTELLSLATRVAKTSSWGQIDLDEKVYVLLLSAIKTENLDIIDRLYSQYHITSTKNAMRLIAAAITTRNLRIIQKTQEFLNMTDDQVGLKIWTSGDPEIIQRYPSEVPIAQKIRDILRSTQTETSQTLLENILNKYEASQEKISGKDAYNIVLNTISWQSVPLLKRVWSLFKSREVKQMLNKNPQTALSYSVNISSGYAIIDYELVDTILNNILIPTSEVLNTVAEYAARNIDNDSKYFDLVLRRADYLDWDRLGNIANSTMNYNITNYINNMKSFRV